MNKKQIAICVSLCLILFLPFNLIADDGKVIFVIGKVQVLKQNGDIQRLKKGSIIISGDTVVTQKRGQAQIKMSDGTLIAVRPDSEFKIDDYQYNKDVDSDKSIYGLVKGGFRSITGKMGKAKKSSYAVKTVVGTIGIRGTDFSARICDANCGEHNDGLYIGVMEGGVVLTNDGGQLDVAPGDFGYISDSAIQPSYLEEIPGDLLFAKSGQSENAPVIAKKQEQNSTTLSIKDNSSIPVEETTVVTEIIGSNGEEETVFSALSSTDMAALTDSLMQEDVTDTTTGLIDNIEEEAPVMVLPSTGSAVYLPSSTASYTQPGDGTNTGVLDSAATTLSIDFVNAEVETTIIADINGESWLASSDPMNYDEMGNFEGPLSVNVTPDSPFEPSRTNGNGSLTGVLGETYEPVIGAPNTVSITHYEMTSNETVTGDIIFDINTVSP